MLAPRTAAGLEGQTNQAHWHGCFAFWDIDFDLVPSALQLYYFAKEGIWGGGGGASD
jgi:hypothetical protein